MAFPLPTLRQTFDLFRAAFRGAFPDRAISSDKSYHARRGKVIATVATQLHAQIAQVDNDTMPDTAGDDGRIDRWGKILDVLRKGATGARGAQAGRVRGTIATQAVAGQQLIHQPTGLIFQISNTATVAAVGSDAYVDASIAGVSTGSQTRLAAGETLQFLATPAGLETEVVLVKALDQDGFDAEQFGAYRDRVLDALGLAASGGNDSDYVKWILQTLGFSQGFTYANRAGIGTVDVAALHTGSGAARIPTSGEMADLLAFLKTLAPGTVAGTPGSLRVLTPVAAPQSVEITIVTDGTRAAAFDWNDKPVAPTVLAWTAGTRELQFSGGALPSTLKAGHRITLKGVASNQDGSQLVVEAISAVDKVILQSAPTNAPAATDIIYAGGPLVDPIRNALVGHMNGDTVYAGRGGVPAPEGLFTQLGIASSVGLEVLADGIGTANPGGIYGPWNGGLIRAILGHIVAYKSGVRNYTILDPAADFEATDYAVPLDALIGLITPGPVIVRSA